MNKILRRYLPIIFILTITLGIYTKALAQTTPPLNQKIIEYCASQMDKKVDRGECWDLAKYALDYANAKWTPPYTFGEKVNFKKDDIFPGDIIQLENVKLTFKNGYATYPHHTAIVYEVLADGKYLIAHQNFAGKKKVHTWELDLNFMSKGKIQFYRPEN